MYYNNAQLKRLETKRMEQITTAAAAVPAEAMTHRSVKHQARTRFE